MERLDYAQGVVMARVYEKRLIGKDRLDKMIEAKDAQEAFKVLSETEYSKSLDGVLSVNDYEVMLKNETSRVFKLGLDMLDDKRILEILSLKYDYHNLKTIVKGCVLGDDLSNLFIYSSENNPDKIKTQFESGNFTDVKSEFIKALKDSKQRYEDTHDPQVIDITIDNSYYKHLKSISDSLNIELFTDYIEGLIDFYNITSMLRATSMGKSINFLKEVLVEGGGISISRLITLSREEFERIAASLKSEKIGRSLIECIEEYKEKKSISVIDLTKDKYLEKLNSNSRFITFGPEPIFAYLVAKEKEISVIRLILVGKLNNISPSKLRERLGDI